MRNFYKYFVNIRIILLRKTFFITKNYNHFHFSDVIKLREYMDDVTLKAHL